MDASEAFDVAFRHFLFEQFTDRWQKVDWEQFTDAEQKAAAMLVKSGAASLRLAVTIGKLGNPQLVKAQFIVRGDYYGLFLANCQALTRSLEKTLPGWATPADMPMTVHKSEIRLTEIGVGAKRDYIIGNHKPVDELSWYVSPGDVLLEWQRTEEQHSAKPPTNDSSEGCKKPKTGKTAAEYDRECADFLKTECAKGNVPGPTAVKEKLGCGVKTVYKLPSFMAYWERIQNGSKPKGVSLTPGMLNAATKADDELARLTREQQRDDRSQKVKSRERI